MKTQGRETKKNKYTEQYTSGRGSSYLFKSNANNTHFSTYFSTHTSL